MADITHGTLVAATVTTVTMSADWGEVEVMNRSGAAEIFFTTDGSTPTVAGADTYALPAALGASLRVKVATDGDTVVKLISSGTPTFSVTGGY